MAPQVSAPAPVFSFTPRQTVTLLVVVQAPAGAKFAQNVGDSAGLGATMRVGSSLAACREEEIEFTTVVSHG